MTDLSQLTLETERLLLKFPHEREFVGFAAMHRDPEVMHDYPAILTEAESREKWDRYLSTWMVHGHGRWMIEKKADGSFVGYTGIQPQSPKVGIAAEWEIGWRMVRSAWGHGYATEAAKAALRDGFARCGLADVIAATMARNARSRAVMERLGLEHAPELEVADPASPGAVVYRAKSGAFWLRP